MRGDTDEALGGLSTDALLEAVAATEPPALYLPAGTLIAERYRLIERLGAGGMGVVYRAHDPQLARDVAIKILLGESDEGERRLLREAVAMARLSHPNVVVAHDVGRWARGVFIAMELVEGRTVHQWLDERPRTWREVRDVFLAAGEGLHAMHEAGLVHRDFKPSNVLIDRRARVRVADLGLVRADGDGEAGGPSSPLEGPLEGSLTGSSFPGTPAFMAPEQRAGQRVTGLADQYAFCVALSRALPQRAPARLRVVLGRGTSEAPEDRFPSMAELLAALRYDPERAWRRAAIAAALVVMGGLAVLGFATRAEREPACDGEAFVATVWNDGARAALRTSFVATGRPYAEDTFQRAGRLVDGYAGALAAEQVAACRAARTESTTLSDLRAHCLAGRRARLGALLGALSRADGAVVDSAIQAIGGLDEVSACADTARLLDAPLPADRAARAAIAALEERVASMRALQLTGRIREALELAPAVVADARSTGHAPLEARALTTHASLAIAARDDKLAERLLREAMVASARAREDELAAQNVNRLMWLIGYDESRFEEGLALLPAAEAAAVRAGATPARLAELHGTAGLVLTAKGDYLAARRALLESILHEDLARRPTLRFTSWNNLSLAARRAGLLAEAEHAVRHAIAITVPVLGPEHIVVGRELQNLGTVLSERGDPEAVVVTRRALDIVLAALGPESPDAAAVWNNLGAVRVRQGDHAAAMPELDRALAMKVKVLRPGHPSIGGTLRVRATALVGLGRAEAALADAREAVAIFEKAKSPELAETLVVLARAELALGRPREARATLDRVDATRVDGETYHHVLGLLARQEGRLAAALTEQRQALAIGERRVGAGHVALAPIRDELAALDRGARR